MTAIGGRRKRAIITYAATASIAYLVKNFTSAQPRPAVPEPPPDAASTSASMPLFTP